MNADENNLRSSYEQLQRSGEQASVLYNLANLYLSQGRRLDEAERHALCAVALKETQDLLVKPWNTYDLMAEIAVARNCAVEAASWQRKAQDSYAAYAGSAHAIRNWQPVITAVVAFCHVNAQPTGQLAETLDQLSQTGDWHNAVGAIREILAGERDIEQLRGELNYTCFVIIHTTLAQLSGVASA